MINLDATLNRYKDGTKSVHVLRVQSTYARGTVRLGVGGVPAGMSARKVYQGPLVEGPWAYTFPLASVIDNNGGTGAERQRNLAAGTEHDVSVGDTFLYDGLVYTLTEDSPRSDYPTLTLVSA